MSIWIWKHISACGRLLRARSRFFGGDGVGVLAQRHSPSTRKDWRNKKYKNKMSEEELKDRVLELDDVWPRCLRSGFSPAYLQGCLFTSYPSFLNLSVLLLFLFITHLSVMTYPIPHTNLHEAYQLRNLLFMQSIAVGWLGASFNLLLTATPLYNSIEDFKGLVPPIPSSIR